MPENRFSKRIQREKETIKLMAGLYCRKNHGMKKDLCPDCQALLNYAYQRLDKCKFGSNKPVCNKCPVHCYQTDMREKVRQVMRYAGPRMIFAHPLAAMEHFKDSLKKF
ncbi:MAG: nitrous oxide-stimulated promoter family protein [Dehalobacterium sp.]